MQKHLVEIKARTTNHLTLRQKLLTAGAEYRGRDHQIDHYFNVPTGRCKPRSGTIEQTLISSRRADQAGPKDSAVTLTPLTDRAQADSLAATLSAAYGTWVTVDKQREIYFIGNVKFHLDDVAGLGTFVEVEAIGESAAQRAALERQCAHYVEYLEIRAEDLVDRSYSDLLA